MESYKNTVVARLNGLSKAILDMTIPLAVERVCSVIQQKLRAFYKSSIIHALISLGLNTAGVLLVWFAPFGQIVSSYMGTVFFVTAFTWTTVRIIRDIRKYGRTVVRVAQSIWKKRSVSLGIEDYVFSEFSEIAVLYAGIEVAANYCSSLKAIPKCNELVKLLIQTFWKQLALFGGIAAVYLVLIYGIIRPFVLEGLGEIIWHL